MKVNQNPPDSPGISQLGKTAGIGPGGRANSALTRTDRDRVQLSDLSSRLLASADAGAWDRTSRVEQLTSDVRSGRYQVDSAELSSRLVDEAIRQ